MTTGLAVAGGTASTIVALAARIARVSLENVDSTTRLSLLGIDSVGAIELAVAIEERFGIAMPADVMLVCRNIASLSEYVEAQLSSSCASTRDTGLDEKLADAVLPDDVAPREIRAIGEHRVRYTEGLLSARTILLTGATGFLGSWMVRELLDRSDALLICLVRGSDRPAGDRLHSVLLDAGVTASALQQRIRTVDANLAAPRLGLSLETFDRLGDEIDAICHAGAAVNWVLPYRGLKAANVDGTRELLRLACRRGVPFHFVSSISVCHSTSAPPVIPAIDDQFDPLAHLGGIHLGYAQTKAVAEALVREAGRRGLPVTIYRPSFISGHGTSGAFNPDDILARVVAGCVRMRTAPDLDWVLDCMPVDSTARHILALSDRRGVVHLRHHQPRHWRECVLWMRLVGYDVRLVPYHAWLRQLEVETAAAGDPSHPLRPLRGFFLNRPAQAAGLTLPELLLATRVEIRGAGDRESLIDQPPLDASLLQRYFDAFVATGVLPPTTESTEKRGTEKRATEYTEYTEGGLDEGFFSRAMGKHVTAVEAAGRLSDHSVISELTAWRCGRPTGLFRYRVRLEGEPDSRELVVKLKASDRDSIAVGEALARICDERVGEAYARSAHRIGLAASHVRELAIYSHRDRRFVDHTPAVLGTVADESTGTWGLVLEYVSNAVARDAAARPEEWTAARIDRALQGLASLHSIWVGQEAELRRAPWIGHVPSAVDVADMSDLWAAIGAHAAPRFSAWADPQISSIQRRLIATIDRWWPWLEQSPRTLIHNDFNPRNICLRVCNPDTRLVAYDWELATIGAPQRDLAELLCFVLTSEATTPEIDGWVERYRILFGRASGIDVDAETWKAGFRASLYDLMLARLPMYALIHRVRPQPFLPRIVRTWRRMYERWPIAEGRLSSADC